MRLGVIEEDMSLSELQKLSEQLKIYLDGTKDNPNYFTDRYNEIMEELGESKAKEYIQGVHKLVSSLEELQENLYDKLSDINITFDENGDFLPRIK